MAVASAVSIGAPVRVFPEVRSIRRFQLVLLAVAGGAAFVAGWVPIQASIVALFLFAGPHNWMEFRYFLSHMPARWGPAKPFFTLAIAGSVALTVAFAAIPWMVGGEAVPLAVSGWNTVFLLWILALFHLRTGRNRTPGWVAPAAFAAIASAWIFPQPWDLLLVYLHPILALVFFGRMVRQRRPEWTRAYASMLLVVPVLLGLLGMALASAPAFPGEDLLTLKIADHAGAAIWGSVSPRFLVAAHLFLQMLHYAVWIVGVPMLALRTTPWEISSVPLARRSGLFRKAVAGFLVAAVVAVVALWGGFLADYPATRDIYFTAAMLHVLIEFPFLIRTL